MHEIPLWRKIQKNNFSNLDALADFLELPTSLREQLINRPSFPLNLPRRLADKIQKKTLDDPILKQFVGLKDEHIVSDGFCSHPTDDVHFGKTPKLLQKYASRALLITTGACAMHCRFCFRQHYPYNIADKSFTKELELLARDPSLIEVILSGGDPLSLSDARLKQLITDIASISHIKLLRFHSRFPIGIPERITEAFLDILKNTTLQVVFIAHVNHPLELDPDVCLAFKKIQQLGIPVLNHTVLLHGVNDELNTLIALNLALISAGIIPYYLHQLDKAQGCAHFEVPVAKGITLIHELRKHLPGYAIPEYIQEVPGEQHKTPLVE